MLPGVYDAEIVFAHWIHERGGNEEGFENLLLLLLS